MSVTIKLRRGTTAQWSSANPILSLGEVGIDTDLKQFKVGDGATAWSSLAFTTAPVNSPTFTGTPTAPTANAGTNTTQIATTAFVSTAITNLINGAPGALDTLDELAQALGDDASFATTVTNSLSAKAPLASPTFTGTVVLPSTTSIGDVSNTEISYLDGVTSAIQTQLNDKANTTISTNLQTASYTLVAGDAGKLVEMNVGSANNLTVPLNSSVPFPVGTKIDILQVGAGQTTIVATGGVTINANPGLKLSGQWAAASLVKRATDTWVLIGNISA